MPYKDRKKRLENCRKWYSENRAYSSRQANLWNKMHPERHRATNRRYEERHEEEVKKRDKRRRRLSRNYCGCKELMVMVEG